MGSFRFFRDTDGCLGRIDSTAQKYIMQPRGQWVPYGTLDYYLISEARALKQAGARDIYAPVDPNWEQELRALLAMQPRAHPPMQGGAHDAR